MTLLGIVYPHSQDCLAPNRRWQVILNKENQVAGALWQEEEGLHSTHMLQEDNATHYYCLYGNVFSKADNRPLSKADLPAIVLKGPEQLTAQFWGKYLWVCFDKVAQQFICVSDPSSQWAVYWSWSARYGLLFSDSINCLYEALSERGERPGWNGAFFPAWLHTGSVQNGDMPFDSISELPAGCALVCTPRRKPHIMPVWDPLAHSSQSATQNPFDLLKSYLKLHISHISHPVLELSGGLESSSVLLALRAISAPERQLTCAHYYNAQVASSNELAHAKSVAQHARAHLHEVDTQTLSFAPVQTIPRMAKPHIRYCLLGFNQEFASRLENQENTPLISGHGGDALFLAPPPFSVLADAVLGLRWRQMMKIAMELALMHRTSLPQVARKAMQSLFAADPSENINGNFALSSEASQQLTSKGRAHLHPFFQKTKIRRPGKLYQLFLAFLSLDDIRAPAHPFKNLTHYPFLCQPMIELGVSTPSYTHFEGVHNRIILRKSVSRATDYANLWRRNKGETSGIDLLGIRQHKKHIMELCLEGFLAKEGYIDVAKTHMAIQESSKGRNEYFMDILHIFAVELFMQGWRQA